MPENGRSPSDEGPDKDKQNDDAPAMAGGAAITATLTGAVEQVSKDVREANVRGSRADETSEPDNGLSETEDDEHGLVAESAPDHALNGKHAVAAAGTSEASPPGRSRLRDAMRRARQNDAERNDVIADLRETEIARLEVLSDSVQDVFEELPDSTDLFDGQVSQSEPPRLWIDVLAYVVMGRDKRTYQFVQETRQGRKVVTETTSVDQMGEQITNYIAHRMIERERALLSEPVAPSDDTGSDSQPADASQTEVRNGVAAQAENAENNDKAKEAEPSAPAAAGASTALSAAQNPVPESIVPRYSGLAMIISFLLGMVVGAIALFLIGANYTPPAG